MKRILEFLTLRWLGIDGAARDAAAAVVVVEGDAKHLRVEIRPGSHTDGRVVVQMHAADAWRMTSSA